MSVFTHVTVGTNDLAKHGPSMIVFSKKLVLTVLPTLMNPAPSGAWINRRSSC